MDDDAAVASTSSDRFGRSKQDASPPPVITVAVAELPGRPSLRPSLIRRPRRALDDVTVRESEEELRRVMKTVSDSFAESRRVVTPTGSPDAANRSSSAASDVSSTSDLMEHFMSELDLVFSDIMAEEDLKSFRHSMQTASEASSPVHEDPVRCSSSTAQRHQPVYVHHQTINVVAKPPRCSATVSTIYSSTPSSAMPVDVAGETTARPAGALVVPLAVLDEFAGVGCGAGLGTDSELDVSAAPSIASMAHSRRSEYGRGRRIVSSGSGQCRPSNGPTSPTSSAAGARPIDAAPSPPHRPRTVFETTAIVDTCVVDMNSNAKDRANTALLANSRIAQTLSNVVATAAAGHGSTAAAAAAAAVNALRRYDNWDPTLFDDDFYTSDVTADGDDVTESHVNPMLEFAEQYFNAHPSQHVGYQSALVRTVNIVTRKSLSDSVPLEDLLRFTKNSTIFTSHVRLIDTDNVSIACAMFKDVHRYMRGNSGSSLTEKSPNCLVRTVISHCLQRPELRDELYCALVRMTTDMPASVADEQRCRLWTLFCLCAVSFSPSHTLRKYLIAHLRRVVRNGAGNGAGVTIEGTVPSAGQDSKQTLYAKYCLRHIASPRTQTRKFAPSNAEIEAMTSLQPLVYRIHFLDSKTKAIAVECSETSADALCRVADKIGLQSTYGWALYESLPDHDRYIRSTEFLADIIADWEEKQRTADSGSLPGTPKKNLIVSTVGGSPPPTKSHVPPAPVTAHSYGKLVMCKRFCQRVGDVADDPVELRLLYFQAVHYVVHLDEYQVPVSTSLHLAGLQNQVEFGNYDEAKISRYAEPEEMLCQRVLLTETREWSQELAAAHKRYGKNKSAAEAMRKYLAVVSQFPLYGCTKVFAHYRGVWAYGVETVIAINYDGIKLISVQEKKLAVDLYFSEIEEIQLQERHGECHVIFQLRNSVSQGRQKTYLFECLELDELASLVECYSPVHATWSSRSGGSSSTSSSWRIDHNKPVGDWHRLYDSILQCRRVLVQSGIVKYTMHEEVSFLRSAFNRISGRNCGSLSRHHRSRSESPGLADDAEASDQANQVMVHGTHWAFTKVPFKTSLLAGQTHDIEDIAVRMFNSSLVYSGLEFSAALDDMDLVVVVQTLLHKCMDNEGLCNECFLQLIKQTTDTKTGPEHRSKNIPLVESSQRAVNQYWNMMTMATCVMLPPCSVILTYLRLHLRRYAMLENAEEGKFAKFCAKSLYRTQQNRGRKYPPSYKEIMFVTKRQPIECRVYLADGHPMLVEFDSAATAIEVIQMVKAKAGMRLDADGFALFQIVKDREEYIAPEVKLADCLYQWEKSSRVNHSASTKDFKILFKKRLFVEPFVNLNDPVEIDLLYHQSVTDVFEQKIPLTKSDAVQLCALRAQAEYGDHGHANNFDYNTVVRILPRHLRELTSSAEIRAIHQTLVGTAPLIANVAFLEILKQWPLYGAILFEVSSSLEYLPKTVWLAVSQLGLHLMEFKGQNIYVTYTFDEIISCTPANKSLTVTISSDVPPSSILVFFTSEGAQIVQLVNDYREILARRRKLLLKEEGGAMEGHASDDCTSHLPVAASSGRRPRGEHRSRTTTHKALMPSAAPAAAARRRDVMKSGMTRHRSPTSSPEHDIKGLAPVLTHTKNRSGTVASAGQPNRGHLKYQRVKDGSRHVARRSQFQNSRPTDSKHEGIFE